MTKTIHDVFLLPRPEDIRAMGFVVRLHEMEAGSEEVKRLVDDYVITPAVEKELPRILDDMKQVFDRGEEYGRFIHGSFGSGKSHFMTMLALLVEGAAPAWKKMRPLLEAHRRDLAAKGRDAADHEAWLSKAGLLVVRIHMLSVRGRTTGLDRVLYEGFNQALKRRGKAPFEFLNVEAVFDEVRREAAEYGDIVWKRLETAGIVGSREEFEALATGSMARREQLARAWLSHKGRDAETAGVDPRWGEGLKRMAQHAKAQGFGGIVLMIDEYLLWLSEKAGHEFAQEINNLNVIVDHTTGQRAAPIFVFVARQRNLQEFFPELVDETKIHEHLDHHAKRFEETKLEDVELRHIVKGRVLRPKDAAAIQRAVATLSERHQRVLPALLAGGDIEYLRDVYPFHPALIEMLVDVTSLMQRERSALRLLYELLVLHHPALPLGEFLPVGSAFNAIFTPAGVEASKKGEMMQDIHKQYYQRLAPSIEAMGRDATLGMTVERTKALDQLVKTVLLGEVSPRLRQNGLTVERLVQLNSADVEGETFRGQVRVAETDLLNLSAKVPDLQIAGSGKTAIVRYVLGKVSLSEVLSRARSKVDNEAQRFGVFWPALLHALGLTGEKGFEEGNKEKEGDYDLVWRRTKRRGRVRLGNVRTLKLDDFEPPAGTFKVLVDYPWDDPGHTVDEDRMKATDFRKARGERHVVCWLPRHMSPTELAVMTELAAVRYLRSQAGQDDLLDTLGPQDRGKILEQAGVRENTLKAQLDDLLKEVYVKHGELYGLLAKLDGARPHEELSANLAHIATVLMDRQFPEHPVFLAEPKRQDLELLLAWMVQAGETGVSVPYDEPTGKVLTTLGQPLELVNLGQTKASLRIDSRYIKGVLQKADHDSVPWGPIAEHLRDTFGFQPLLVDLFLCFLCQRDHRAIEEGSGDPLEVRLGMAVGTRIKLQRGKLLGLADWHRLRDLGAELFGLPRPSPTRSLQGQDRFKSALKTEGDHKRGDLQALQQRLLHLGVEPGDRLREIATANARLSCLALSTTDSHKVLADLLAQWPDDPTDPLRFLVREAAAIRDALAELSEHARKNLQAGAGHAAIGPEVRDHLEKLGSRLATSQRELPITREWIAAWNQDAQRLIHRLIEQPIHPAPLPTPEIARGPVPVPDGGSPVAQKGSPAPPAARAVLVEGRVDPASPDSIAAFVASVRKALAGQPTTGAFRVTLVREEGGE